MSMDTLLGNEAVKNMLEQALESHRVGHAYIIEGKKGTGRMTLAKAFAAQVLKTDNPDNHPDFVVATNQRYDVDKKKDGLSIQAVRSMKSDLYIKPYMDGKKVYVIPQADLMEAPAQNSLLKVFEEPPEYGMILMLAENANEFLPTILSRATLLRTSPLSAEQVADYLVQEKDVPKARAEQLAILSGGAIGRALELLEDQTVVSLREETFQSFLSMVGGTYRDMFEFVNFLKKNKGNISSIIEFLLSWSQDTMYRKLQVREIPITNIDKEKELAEFCAKLSRDAALHLSEIVVKYQKMIEQNVNYSVAVLCMATELWEEIHGRNYRS